MEPSPTARIIALHPRHYSYRRTRVLCFLPAAIYPLPTLKQGPWKAPGSLWGARCRAPWRGLGLREGQVEDLAQLAPGRAGRRVVVAARAGVAATAAIPADDPLLHRALHHAVERAARRDVGKARRGRGQGPPALGGDDVLRQLAARDHHQRAEVGPVLPITRLAGAPAAVAADRPVAHRGFHVGVEGVAR